MRSCFYRIQILFIVSFCGVGVKAQGIDFIDCKCFNAVCSQNMEMWNADSVFDLHSLYRLYFEIADCVLNDNDSADAKIDSLLMQIEPFDIDTQEIFMVRTAMYLFKAYRSRISSIYYLPKVLLMLSDFDDLSQHSAVGWIERGNFYYHLPSQLGGNKSKAAECFQYGINLLEKESADLSCNWYYLNANLWLAKSFEHFDSVKAIAIYEKMKILAPNFQALDRWIEKQKKMLE